MNEIKNSDEINKDCLSFNTMNHSCCMNDILSYEQGITIA